jgi:hypothetical protein
MSGIVEGVAGHAIWDFIRTKARNATGRHIQITNPRPGETLTAGEPLGQGLCFPIRGNLKHLPAGQEIWLLTEDESTGLLWPQGFFGVQYDAHQGTWLGKINGSGKKHVKIHAVVAPSTSQDLFRYFQKVGRLRNYQFEPLARIPPECRNRTYVQAALP